MFIHKKPFFFIEGGDKVIYDNTGFSSIKYKNKILIRDVEKIFKDFLLKKKKEFNDMYIFSDSSIEIVVWLNNEDDLYENENSQDLNNRDNYLQTVKNIIFTLKKQLNKEVYLVVEAIMYKFNLNLYDPNQDIIFCNPKEIKNIA